MPKRDAGDGDCLYCKQPFQRKNPVGRRQVYCSPGCRRDAQRERRHGRARVAPPVSPLPLGRNVAEDLQLLVARLLSAEYEGQTLTARLRLAAEVSREVEYYTSATVQAERADGSSWEQIATAASVSSATARARWSRKEVGRRLSRRAADRATARQPEAARPTPRNPGGEQAVPDAAPRPGGKLAAALSCLHRESGLTIKEAAEQVGSGLSAPYVSRILSGERLPTWEVTEELAVVCGGDPAEVRALWEHAQGMTPPVRHPLFDTVHRLHAALRGLHLSAARPSSERVSEASGGLLTAEQVTSILHGHLVPTWPMTGAFIKALGGWPADVRPLWEAVEYGFLADLEPQSTETNDGAPSGPEPDLPEAP
ncbi:helix-turn-helix domain-containing protein [Streptomyces sp. NPDC102360]|uniref:helix-turn-helix domain-containing protein n=1 Tax=Streptomyces sp. NPDC102360 TaxID=3366160 RepID=UPI00382E43AE